MGLENLVTQKTISLPMATINQIAKEFNITEQEIDSFITVMIQRIIEEHIVKKNSEVFSNDEIKEIEDNLKGLGYI